MGGKELELVKEAFDSNYIAPLGPMVDAFEREFAEYTGMKHCAAVSSGTAAMHLGLRHVLELARCRVQGASGQGRGLIEIFVSTLTFIGSVTPVVFEGAVPVFIDCDHESWNMDVKLLEAELERCAKQGKLPEAVVPTDLYGQCCDLGRIVEICDGYGVPVICDSAEALGARFKSGYEFRVLGDALMKSQNENHSLKTQNPKPKTDFPFHAGKGARAAVYSFNGNKIITTSGGGMLASDDAELIAHAKKLSQQAREDFPYYEHVEIGYNYRMSNILAAIGRGQLRVLDERVRTKREIYNYYQAALGDVPGIEFMPEPNWSCSTHWLTVVLITPEKFGADREQVRLALEAENIESRPVWKPMHLQPVFSISRKGGKEKRRKDRTQNSKLKTQNHPCRVVGGDVSEDLFERGLCLPSGTAMTNSDLDRVIETILKTQRN